MEIPLFTFLTDMGTQDPYLASLEWQYRKYFPKIPILHLSHQIAPYDRLQAAFFFHYLQDNFPKNTVHVLSVGNADRYLWTYHNDVFLIAPDNGLLPLLTLEDPGFVFDIPLTYADLIFPAIGLLPYIQMIQKKEKFEIAENIIKNNYPIVKKEEKKIQGQIMYIDRYDNALTNIHYYDFQSFYQYTHFLIKIRNLFEIKKISSHYQGEKEGEVLAIFNQKNYLEIAFNGGRKMDWAGAGNLLGLKVGDPIAIDFY